MFESQFIANAINRSAENRLDRRRFLKAAGVGGLGVGAASLLGAPDALAEDTQGPSDAAILNFALNLEYLEAEFYSMATTGSGLPDSLTNGTGKKGSVTGGRAVPFKTPNIKQYALEIANDEKEHVTFLRGALGSAAVSRPAINLDSSFTAAATAAGVIKPGEKFDPYQSEQLFLWAAFIFEDVGVTAYKGAAPLINNKTYLSAAAGILATEAYHASLIRSTLYNIGQAEPATLIAKVRDSLDGAGNDDQGISVNGTANIVPADANGIVFGRSPGQVLNILYLTPGVAAKGGFFPDGVNGTLNQSGSAAPAAGSPGAAPNNPPGATPPGAVGGSGGGAVGPGVTPRGGAATGAGGTSSAPDKDLLIGSAAAAAGSAAAAVAYHRRRRAAADDAGSGLEAMD